MIKVKLNGYRNEKIPITHPEIYDELKRLSLTSMPEREKAITNRWWMFEVFVNDLQELSALPDEIISTLECEIVRPMRAWSKGDSFEKNITTALQTAQVHLPGNELLKFNEIKVMNDCCTDALNEEMKSLWRIIAVCIQPDQRRPDYVLGRILP